tara:strand:+ start:178 stop:396 length:219 start_codon:yes stop_codon:yes gene_type:complete
LDINKLSLRKLQQESAKALFVIQATNKNIYQFNQQAHHNSQNWYKAVIKWYMDQYGGLPSEIGPAKDIKLIS